jgi:hypothetical protein
VLGGLHIFLTQLNPILSYLNFDVDRFSHFLSAASFALHYKIGAFPNGVPGYALGQMGIVNGESLMLRRTRPSNERGNAYLAPNAYNRGVPLGINAESFDCNPSGGEVRNASDDGTTQVPPCFVQPKSLYDNRFFPHLDPGRVRLAPSPRGTLQGTKPANPNR